MHAVVDNSGGRRSWFVALAGLAVLLILGFYTLTDPARLSGSALLNGADYAGYTVCHRITERSFTIAGRQLPLCARCTGIYLGIVITFLLFGLAGRWRWAELPRRSLLLVFLGLIGLMGIDGVNSYSHFFPQLPHAYTPQNWLRLLTGMGTGLAVGVIIFPALAQTLWHEQVFRPILASWRELAGLLLVAGVVILLVLSNQPLILYVLGVASAAGVVLILSVINAMFLLIILRRDAQFERWSQTIAPLSIGLGIALCQIALVSVLRYSWTGTLTGFPGL